MKWLRSRSHVPARRATPPDDIAVPVGMVIRECNCDYHDCHGWVLDFPPEYYAIHRRRWDDPRGREPRLVKGRWI